MENNNTLKKEVEANVQPSLFDYFTEQELMVEVTQAGEPANKYLVKEDENWWDFKECFDSKFFQKLYSSKGKKDSIDKINVVTNRKQD